MLKRLSRDLFPRLDDITELDTRIDAVIVHEPTLVGHFDNEKRFTNLKLDALILGHSSYLIDDFDVHFEWRAEDVRYQGFNGIKRQGHQVRLQSVAILYQAEMMWQHDLRMDMPRDMHPTQGKRASNNSRNSEVLATLNRHLCDWRVEADLAINDVREASHYLRDDVLAQTNIKLGIERMPGYDFTALRRYVKNANMRFLGHEVYGALEQESHRFLRGVSVYKVGDDPAYIGINWLCRVSKDADSAIARHAEIMLGGQHTGIVGFIGLRMQEALSPDVEAQLSIYLLEQTNNWRQGVLQAAEHWLNPERTFEETLNWQKVRKELHQARLFDDEAAPDAALNDDVLMQAYRFPTPGEEETVAFVGRPVYSLVADSAKSRDLCALYRTDSDAWVCVQQSRSKASEKAWTYRVEMVSDARAVRAFFATPSIAERMYEKACAYLKDQP